MYTIINMTTGETLIETTNRNAFLDYKDAHAEGTRAVYCKQYTDNGTLVILLWF